MSSPDWKSSTPAKLPKVPISSVLPPWMRTVESAVACNAPLVRNCAPFSSCSSVVAAAVPPMPSDTSPSFSQNVSGPLTTMSTGANPPPGGQAGRVHLRAALHPHVGIGQAPQEKGPGLQHAVIAHEEVAVRGRVAERHARGRRGEIQAPGLDAAAVDGQAAARRGELPGLEVAEVLPVPAVGDGGLRDHVVAARDQRGSGSEVGAVRDGHPAAAALHVQTAADHHLRPGAADRETAVGVDRREG